MGPAGSPPSSSVMPGMAGGSSALSSPQCLGQQAFGEGGANKGYVVIPQPGDPERHEQEGEGEGGEEEEAIAV